MRLVFSVLFAASLACSVMVNPGHAENVKLGDIEIEKPMIKATPPKAPVSGGFLVVRNSGQDEDHLVGAKVDFAEKVEIHEMKMEDGVMKMRPLANGLAIPAGGEAVLKPGGYHIMFMKLKEQMKEGETRKVTLEFEKAGEVEVEFPVGMPMKPMN